MKFLKVLLLLLFICGTTLIAQNYEKTKLGVKTKVNSLDLEIQFINPSTIRILKSPQGDTYTKESLSVIAKPEDVKFSIEETDKVVTLKSDLKETAAI